MDILNVLGHVVQNKCTERYAKNGNIWWHSCVTTWFRRSVGGETWQKTSDGLYYSAVSSRSWFDIPDRISTWQSCLRPLHVSARLLIFEWLKWHWSCLNKIFARGRTWPQDRSQIWFGSMMTKRKKQCRRRRLKQGHLGPTYTCIACQSNKKVRIRQGVRQW